MENIHGEGLTKKEKTIEELYNSNVHPTFLLCPSEIQPLILISALGQVFSLSRFGFLLTCELRRWGESTFEFLFSSDSMKEYYALFDSEDPNR